MKLKWLKYIFIIVIIPILLEIFVFNINTFKSLFYKSNTYNATLLQRTSEFLEDENIPTYTYIYEIKDIYQKVNNIYVNIDSESYADIKIRLTDSANKRYFTAGTQAYVSNVEDSKYINVHTRGKTKKIKLEITSFDKKFDLNNISINKTVPFSFNLLRVFLCIFIIGLIVFIKDYGYILNVSFNIFKVKWIYVIGFLIIIYFMLGFTYNIGYNKNVSETNKLLNKNQYGLLAKSLSKGKTYLDLNVSDKLKGLANPYDTNYRDKHLASGLDYYWDFSYYKGKYYSYFGIVPCITIYLPFYLITGNDYSNSCAVLVTGLLYFIGSFYLVYQILNKYFKKTTFKWYLILSIFLAFTSGASFAFREGGIYSVPILMGSAFAMIALGFWIKSSNNKIIDKKSLLIGSILMALVIGCRPQMVISSILIIPIFYNHIKNKEVFKIKNLLCIIIPFIIIGSLLMYYNYVRFGSLFDFGANYNLTTNDMTKRGFVFDRIFLGIYSFLFEIPRVTPIFPFIANYEIISTYHGITIYEDMAGGFFIINILSMLNLFIFNIRKLFKNKCLYAICLLSLLCSLIIIILDTQMAGILPRYICDFGFLINISTIIIILNILNNYKGNLKLVKKFIFAGFVISIICICLTYFSHIFLNDNYLKMFYYVYYTIMFWV